MNPAWTSEERKRIKAAFVAMCEAHSKPVSTVLLETYMKVLEQLDAASAIQLIEKATFTARFFPRPIELIEMLVGSPDERASKAWTVFEKAAGSIGKGTSIFFEDPRISCIIEFFGGWEAVGQWMEKDIVHRRREFMEQYQAINNPPPPIRHVGTNERHNAAYGYIAQSDWVTIGIDGTRLDMRRHPAPGNGGYVDLPLIPAPKRVEIAGPEETQEDTVAVADIKDQLLSPFKGMSC